jgi:hypothetical protein
MTNEEITELLKDKSTSTKKLEEILDKILSDDSLDMVGSMEYLCSHPNSSAKILDTVLDEGMKNDKRHDVEYYSEEISRHPNASIKALKSLQYDVDRNIAEQAQKQLKKRGAKAKKHPLRGKDIYVVMYSHSDGCDSYVYAEEEHADAKEAQLEKKLGGGDGCVWIEVQEIK